MFKIPLADLKQKILSTGKITQEELELRIKAKINDLSGLISEEGASHIIANELGIPLVDPQKERLKIKEIYPGMRQVSTVGKVLRKFDVNTFKKEEREGKVCSLIIGDETGSIRLVLWNEQVDLVSTVNEDDIVLVKDAYVRENRGGKEIHLGKLGELAINPEGETVSNVRAAMLQERKQIQELQGGEEQVELLGTVVQVFDPRFFQRAAAEGKPAETSYVLNLVLDDGTGTIRTVFWKQQVHHLLGKSEEEMLPFKENMAAFEDVKTDLLGEQLKLTGRVKKDDYFNRLELHVRFVEKAKPEEELARLEQNTSMVE
ncbi:MAG: OB-fold nucleic acid binding domain-containing protein [Nanoarchaeota archaeon]|nr:OB-fold nucleic acid binding domain-containing protein [Nanoarchaeota archaeon]